MTEPSETLPSPNVSGLKPGRLLLLVLFIGLVAAVGWLFVKLGSLTTSLEATHADLERERANREELENELATREISLLDEQTRVKITAQELAEQIELARSEITRLQTEIDDWQEMTEELMNTDLGRRIAADEDLLLQLHTLLAEDRPDPKLARNLQSRAETLMSFVNRALETPNAAHQPTPELRLQVDELHQRARIAIPIMARRNQRLRAILAQAPEEFPADTPELQSAIEHIEDRWAARENQRIADEVRKAREEKMKELEAVRVENEKKLVDAQIEAERERGPQEVASVRAAAEKAAEAERLRLQKEKEKAQREKLERQFEAEYARMKGLLTPFTSKGYKQPKGRMMERMPDPAPVSFSRLQGSGTLDRTARGLEALRWVTTANNYNDRPLGAFPPYETSSFNFDSTNNVVQGVQDFLIQYGPLMVEKGLLSE